MCKFTVTVDGCGNCSSCQNESPNFNDVVIPKTLGLVFKTKADGTQDDSKLEEGDRYHGYVEDQFIQGIYLGGERCLLSSYNVLSSTTNS
jgi:hypothetical protein